MSKNTLSRQFGAASTGSGRDIAIGFAWMAFIGLCTAFLMSIASPPQGTPGGVLLSAILPFASGVLIVIIGGALRYANTPK